MRIWQHLSIATVFHIIGMDTQDRKNRSDMTCMHTQWGVTHIMHIFHATRQASLNKGLRDGKWEWCIYGSTYSLQQCSISLVWTQMSRKIRSDMTCMHIQWDMTHNVCFSCNKQGYLYQGGLWWKTTVMCIWQHLFAATVIHMIDIDIPGQENQVCHDLNAYSMRCDS